MNSTFTEEQKESMEKFTLTDKQKKFLLEHKDEHPFDAIPFTVSYILQYGVYDMEDRIAINRAIKSWKLRNVKKKK